MKHVLIQSHVCSGLAIYQLHGDQEGVESLQMELLKDLYKKI